MKILEAFNVVKKAGKNFVIATYRNADCVFMYNILEDGSIYKIGNHKKLLYKNNIKKSYEMECVL